MSENVLTHSNWRKEMIKLVTKAVPDWNLIKDGESILIACIGVWIRF